uniref:Uncharacterized protein n=1 Tax=Anopheles christyi TaxID=43041 RepID=A0A182KI18_9DIPT
MHSFNKFSAELLLSCASLGVRPQRTLTCTPISSTVGRQTRVGGADCSTTVYGTKLGRHAGKLYRDVIVLDVTTTG